MATGIDRPSAGSLPPFSLAPSDTAGPRWDRWLARFENYLVAAKITEADRQRALLLHVAGEEVFSLHLAMSAVSTFASLKRKLTDHFTPKRNREFEVFRFRAARQEHTESADSFVARLRTLAKHCEFADDDAEIKSQLVQTCVLAKLREKAFMETNITLANLLVYARSLELMNTQLSSMGSGGSQAPGVNAISRSAKTNERRSDDRSIVCFNCGKNGHMARDSTCPAKGKKCRACGKLGHFKEKCRGRTKEAGKGFKQPAGRKGTAHSIEKEPLSKEYVFSVGNPGSSGIVSLVIGTVTLGNVMIDSGASSNVISVPTWETLKRQGVDVLEAKKTSERQLYAYGSSTPLQTRGVFKTEVYAPASAATCTAEFVVVEGEGRSLLGKATAEELGLLRVGPEIACAVSDDAEIKGRFPMLFAGVGKLKDFELKLHIDENVHPIAQRVRRIPFHLRQKVDAKIDELLETEIIEPVPDSPSTWVSPLVVIPKRDGDVRVCVDMRQANQAIQRERYPVPSTDELLTELNGSKVFSKLDLRWGFHQIPLAEGSRDITTFITHRGLFRYKRLMFGVSSAPEQYQRVIRDVLRSCEGVINIADDIIVHGATVEEHDRRLLAALERLQEVGLTLNGGKCAFRLRELVFFGHKLTSDGVQPSEEKVAAVRNALPPATVAEVRSFMGLVQYCARFIPDLATISEPIQKLTRKDVPFSWGTRQQEAFDQLKSRITATETLAYFDPQCKTRIVADASPYGLGAVLTQNQDGHWRVISYASRSLTAVERRYSQTEREALALVWACERFNLYVFGASFELETDHKPLEYVYAPRSKPSARIERWVLRLQAFEFKVVYRPGKTNIADSLSRLKQPPSKDVDGEDIVYHVVRDGVPTSMTAGEIERASADDPELMAVRQCVLSGDWTDCPNQAYLHVKDEVCVCGYVLLRGDRIIMPQSLRDRVVRLAHEGHQGITKTKARLRTKVWWPKMDAAAENVCRRCHECQVVDSTQRSTPMLRTRLPTQPWQDLAWDNRCRARESSVSVGDKVLIRTAERKNKLTPAYQPQPATVVSRGGEEVHVRREDGSVLRRHASHIKPYLEPGGSGDDDQRASLEEPGREADPRVKPTSESSAESVSLPVELPQRPQRTRVPPAYLTDYVT